MRDAHAAEDADKKFIEKSRKGIETFLFVVEGAAVVEGGGGGKVDMVESDCLVLKAGETFTVAGVDAQAILMLTQCRPNRNAETYGYVGFQGA